MNTELLKSKLLEAAFNGSLTHADTSKWRDFALGDIFLMKAGKNVTAADISEEQNEKCPYPCYGGNGLRGYVKDYNTEGIFPIIGRQGALCGNVKYVEGKFFATEHAVVVRNKMEVDSRWAFHALTFLNLNQYATATAQPGLAVSKIEQVRLSLPPIAEQQRIIDALEEGFAYIDAVASAKQNLSDTAEMLRNKILQAAFDGSLTSADASTWEDVKLREVTTKIVDGDHNPPKGEEDPTPYIMLSSQNINDDTYVAMNKVRYLSKENFDMCNKRTHLTKGDVLLTSVGTIGRSCVHNSDEVYCFQRSVTIITPTINSYFLKYYFDSPAFQQMLNMSSTGNAQKGFYLNKLKEVLIPLPSPKEQERIVAKIEELFTQIDKITK